MYLVFCAHNYFFITLSFSARLSASDQQFQKQVHYEFCFRNRDTSLKGAMIKLVNALFCNCKPGFIYQIIHGYFLVLHRQPDQFPQKYPNKILHEIQKIIQTICVINRCAYEQGSNLYDKSIFEHCFV